MEIGSKGRNGKTRERERCSACCFLEKERIEEGGRVEMEEIWKKVTRRTLSCMLTFSLVLTTSQVCEGVRYLVVLVRGRSLGICCVSKNPQKESLKNPCVYDVSRESIKNQIDQVTAEF